MSIRFTNVAAFNRDLDRFVDKTGLTPGIVAKRLAYEIFGGAGADDGVTQRNPVDTGWSRANWQIGVNRRPEGNPVAKPSENNVLPLPRAPVIVATPKFPVWWVVNNIPYIIYLEEGRSQQMGKGYMVQRTLVKVRSNIKKILREASK